MRRLLNSQECPLGNKCCPFCSKTANLVGILGFIGLVAGIGLVVGGSVMVARLGHLHASHDKKGGYIGMIVVGCLVFLFGIVMTGAAATADLTVDVFRSWLKPETCPKKCKCC
jgi:hypothetical protein